jgi:hypothetical protein
MLEMINPMADQPSVATANQPPISQTVITQSKQPQERKATVQVYPLRVSVTPEVEDLGSHLWSEPLGFSVVVRNDGMAGAIIQRIDTGCHCTTLTQDVLNSVVTAGDELLVEFEMDLKKLEGPQTRTVKFTFAQNEALEGQARAGDRGHSEALPWEPTVEVETSVRFVSLPTWELSTEELDLGSLDLADIQQVSRVIGFKSNYGVEVTATEFTELWANVQQVPEGILIEVDAESLSPRFQSGFIRVQTTDDTVPMRVVQVSIEGTQALIPQPVRVFMLEGEASVTFTHDGHDVELTSVHFSDHDGGLVDGPNVILARDKHGTSRLGTVLLNRETNAEGAWNTFDLFMYVSDSEGRTGRVRVRGL